LSKRWRRPTLKTIQTISQDLSNRLRAPGALAVRAAILAVNGYEEGARGDAHNLGAAQLLPEERVLIAPLLYD